MADPYQTAVNKLSAIKQQMADLQREYERVSQFLQMYQQFADADQIESSNMSRVAWPTTPTPPSIAAAAVQAQQASAAIAMGRINPVVVSPPTGHAEAVPDMLPLLGYKNTKQAIVEMCTTIMSDGFARHTRQLVKDLETMGIQIGGKDKVLTVSAILGKDDRFVANRKYGWSLKKTQQSEEHEEHEQVEEEGPGDAPTSPGLFS